MTKKSIISLGLLMAGLGTHSIIHANNENIGIIGVNILSSDDALVGSATGWKLYTDYFNTLDSSLMWGLEAHFTYLGTPEVSGMEYTQFAGGGSLLAGYDFQIVKAYASLGYSAWGLDASAGPFEGTDSGGTLTYGIGAIIPFGESGFGLSAEWVHFDEVANAEVDTFSAGIAYQF